MKVNGVSADRKAAIFPHPDKPLTFKRGAGKLAFFAQPVWDFDEFHEMVPKPVNKKMRFNKNAPGGKEPDPNDPAYKDALVKYGVKRWGYMVLKTLEPSNIEWETVSLKDPKTWDKVEDELRESLANFEFGKVMALVDEANALDEVKLAENAEDFFQEQLAKEKDANKSSPKDGADSTPSGAPVSGSTAS